MLAHVRRRLHEYKPRIFRLLFIFVVIICVAVFFKAGQFFYHQGITPNVVIDLISGSPDALKQHNHRTNILLLGIGGPDHEGGDLTDTILFISIDTVSKDQLLLSVPRDLWIPDFKNKINEAYRIGEEKIAGGGFILAKSVVEEVIGQPVHYALLVDFNGFTNLIDIVDGVDVGIDESFTDLEYPIKGKENDLCSGDPLFRCRYETVSFQKGIEHMNGERALIYVRSRHAEGDAGSDFARSSRQQAVISALKQKLLTRNVITNPTIVKKLVPEIMHTLKTDVSYGELLLLARQFMGSTPVPRRAALTQDEPEKNHRGLLINPPLWQYDNKWVLIPKHSSFEQIGKYTQCMIENQNGCEALMQ